MLAKESEVEQKLVELSRRDQGLADRETHLQQLQEELKQAKTAELAELERIAGMTQSDAKAHLIERGEELARHELARRVRHARGGGARRVEAPRPEPRRRRAAAGRGEPRRRDDRHASSSSPPTT